MNGYTNIGRFIGPDGVEHYLTFNSDGNPEICAQLQGYNGTNFRDLRIDSQTRALNVIDYEHHEIHAGSSFTCHYSNDTTNTGEMTMIAFNTPNTTKWLHIVVEASSTAGSYLAIYEAADLDVDEGTDLVIYNRDRNSLNASTVTTIETTPEAGKATSYNESQAGGATLSTASEIYRYYMGAATTGADINGTARATSEWILKQNTQYAFVIVATSNDANTHNLMLSWYEHINQAA